MNEEVKALRSELALLKLQFSERVNEVEARLNELIAQEAQTDIQNQYVTQAETANLSITHDEVVETPTEQEESKQYVVADQAWEMAAPAEPSFITLFVKALLSSFFDWISPVTKIYQSYKERGMLGIFILTVVGIGLTLAGFGYLMQLLIDQLGAGSKSLLMCGAAVSVIGLGVVIKVKTRFGEFATAIVTLGILLSYSTVYFSGSVYGLLPNITILILYLVVALVCHVLALWLDTKVVAALGVIGIATMPILSNTIGIEPLYYLLSLAFVVSSSLFLAYRYLGQWLAQLSLAFTLVSVEWIIGVENVQVSAWIVNLFYLLFFVYICGSLLKNEANVKQSLAFLAALVGAIVLVFFQSTDIFTTHISFNFVFNTLITIVVSALFYKIKSDLMHLFILLAATWGVLAIVSVVSDAYWGIAWAIEGLLLLVIGRRFAISSTIYQGQVLTAIALLYSWAAIAPYFPTPALKSVDGWMLSIMIALFIAVWQRLINSNDVFDDLTKTKVKPMLQLLEVIWLSVMFIACANIWLGNWAGVVVILAQIALLFRAKHCKQVSIEVFAAVLIIVPLFYAYNGALSVGSYRFIMLPMFAKLAMVSAFLQLWLWSAFYRKHKPDSPMIYIAESARILFYLLIPICWVGSVVRRFDEASLMIIWLSPLLALLLARKVGHHLLVKETKILTALSSIAFALVVGQLTMINSVITLVGFTSYFAIAYWLNRRETSHIYQFISSCAIFALGFAIPNIIGFQTNSLFYSLVFAAIYWATILNTTNLSEHLKRNETYITAVNLLLLIAAWTLISSNANYVMVPVIFLLAALYKKDKRFINSYLGNKLALNSDLFLHSIAAISYGNLFASLTEYRLDLLIAPALAVHGALILFLKDKRLTTVKYGFALMLLGIIKLAMIDAANALLWQKVILFMGIGVFILLASFWYQKLVTNVDTLPPSVNNL